MDVTDALYLEKMGSLREDQESIRTLKEDDDPDEHHPGKPCEEAHKGMEHDAWVQKELNALEVKVKKEMFTNIIFANEAIMSQGALNHVVGAGGRPVQGDEALRRRRQGGGGNRRRQGGTE
jgi:hypothetical protein